MNILIVDDEVYILRALKAKIDWASLGIETVFTALNIEKAKEILSAGEIDLLLTDIEMPGGTGLQLMDWVRGQGLSPVSACLTCHADFQYAQTALKLGFSEYILKPVDFNALAGTVKRLADVVRERRAQQARSEKGRLWEFWERQAAGSFWRSVITGDAGRTADEIVRLAEQTGSRYHFDAPYTLLLFTPVRKAECLSQWGGDRELLRYAVSNVLSEKFLSLESGERLIWDGGQIWVISEQPAKELLAFDLTDTLDSCKEMLGVTLACYCGESVFGEEIAGQAETLLALSRSNTRELPGVFTADNPPIPGGESTEAWGGAFRTFSDEGLKRLREGDTEGFAALADGLLDRMALGREGLRAFMRLVLLTADYYLMETGRLPMDVEGLDALHTGGAEVETVAEARALVCRLARLLPQKDGEGESATVRQVKAYIESHITEKLSREEIAEKVFLSPDYLTRIFRRETGSSLVAYITGRKMEEARRLLLTHPISEAAQMLGYDNFGYFSELFKRKTGMSPSEFKRKNGNPDGKTEK